MRLLISGASRLGQLAPTPSLMLLFSFNSPWDEARHEKREWSVEATDPC